MKRGANKRGVFGDLIEKPGKTDGFFFGTEDVFELKGSDDIVAVGLVMGKIKTGDTVYITNPGDDDGKEESGTVVGIEINRMEARAAKNSVAALRIKDGKKYTLKTGTVLHQQKAPEKTIHDVYMMALGEGFITFKEMKLSQKEFEKMSLTDLVELVNLYRLYLDNNKGPLADTLTEHDREISEVMSSYLCKKLLLAKRIYVLINKKTGEPHMLSVTYENDNGEIITTPPDIVVLTKAYIDEWSKRFDTYTYEFLEVENGENGRGIHDYLGEAFYLNGACGVRILYENIVVVAEALVRRPDYSNLPEVQVPVTNPDLERWLLLTGQLDPPETLSEDKLQKALYSHLFKALASAKFIVPMKMSEEGDGTGGPDSSDNPDGTLKQSSPDKDQKKETKMTISIQKGKNKKDAVRMYTDWKRFHMAYKEEDGWKGLVERIPNMIVTFDCAINVTDYPKAGCYIDRISFEADIRKFMTEENG
ncbi:MAG: hypothetical protein K5888_03145 [Lachnospiraceae bacterium]|nr:hypothetical protein [Lachnospiraceae bacterium]